jgi:transcription initiation factor TFIID subunit 9B
MSIDSKNIPNGKSDDLPATTPRDVRLLHLILASMGVTSYQERVPLQLMDFAYRYTQGVLQDALQYNDHAYSSTASLPAGLAPSNSPLSVEDVRLAVGARVNYQFKPAPPKELLLELAQEKNKRPLPSIPQTYGLRLPPEKYCLTSKEWTFEEQQDEVMSEDIVLKEEVEQEEDDQEMSDL